GASAKWVRVAAGGGMYLLEAKWSAVGGLRDYHETQWAETIVGSASPRHTRGASEPHCNSETKQELNWNPSKDLPRHTVETPAYSPLMGALLTGVVGTSSVYAHHIGGRTCTSRAACAIGRGWRRVA